MAHNLEYLLTRPGILKMATIVFGILSFALGTFSYANSPYTEHYSNEAANGNSANWFGTELELYQVCVTGVFLGISSAYLIMYGFIYELCESKLNRVLDTSIHMAGSLLIFAGGCVLMYSASEIQDNACDSKPTPYATRIYAFTNPSEERCQYFEEKLVAGSFSVLNAVIYCVTAVTVFTTKNL